VLRDKYNVCKKSKACPGARRGSLWRRRPGILEGKIILGKMIKKLFCP
jgi:hypothetical protein